jgi:hypothetical protein
MSEQIDVTRECLDGLISARNDAKSIGATSFTYDGYDFWVSYANYLIEHCNNILEKNS